MKTSNSGWVLKSPRGKLFPDTFSPWKADCWSESFHTLEITNPKYARKYYKDWDGSLKAAKEMGYTIVKAKIVEVK